MDLAGAVYVTGQTRSCDFPTSHALQLAFGGGDSDAFVVKITDENGVRLATSEAVVSTSTPTGRAGGSMDPALLVVLTILVLGMTPARR